MVYDILDIQHTMIDKVRIALIVIKMQSWLCLKLIWLYSVVFRFLLTMPNTIFDYFNGSISATQGVVNVIHASSDKGIITGKFAMFLKHYIEKGGPTEPFEYDAFDFLTYSKFFGTSMLYLRYFLDNQEKSLSAYRDDNDKCFASRSSTTAEELFLNRIVL